MQTSTHFITIEIGFSNTVTQKGRKIEDYKEVLGKITRTGEKSCMTKNR